MGASTSPRRPFCSGGSSGSGGGGGGWGLWRRGCHQPFLPHCPGGEGQRKGMGPEVHRGCHPQVCTPVLTQPYSGCVHVQTPPCVQAHALRAQLCTCSGCAHACPSEGTWGGGWHWRGSPVSGHPGREGLRGGRGGEESKDGGEGGGVASAGGSGRLTRTNPLIDSLPVEP